MDITKCTSATCQYKDTCYRQVNDNSDDVNQSWYNFEYDCNEVSSFSDFIPTYKKQ